VGRAATLPPHHPQQPSQPGKETHAGDGRPLGDFFFGFCQGFWRKERLLETLFLFLVFFEAT
jgi:hypothetical protein